MVSLKKEKVGERARIYEITKRLKTETENSLREFCADLLAEIKTKAEKQELLEKLEIAIPELEYAIFECDGVKKYSRELCFVKLKIFRETYNELKSRKVGIA